MISNNEIKLIKSLQQKKFRKREGLFVVEGLKSIKELSGSKYEVEKLFLCLDYLGKDNDIISEVDLPFEEISRAKLERITGLTNNKVGLAVVKVPDSERYEPMDQKVTLVLDGIRDPGNMGTIIRTADWFGIKQIITSSDSCDLYNPKVLQATMGSFLRVEVHARPLDQILEKYQGKMPILGAVMDGESIANYSSVEQQVLVIGSESHGISPEVMPFITNQVTIPRLGFAESLNAGVATGILLDRVVQG